MKGTLFARKSFCLHGANHPKIWPIHPHKLHVPYYFSKKNTVFAIFMQFLVILVKMSTHQEIPCGKPCAEGLKFSIDNLLFKLIIEKSFIVPKVYYPGLQFLKLNFHDSSSHFMKIR